VQNLIFAALFLTPPTEPPPALDAYDCSMKGRPGAEKFGLRIQPDMGRGWVFDSFGVERYTATQSAKVITVAEERPDGSDPGAFQIVYELDPVTLAIRLLVVVHGKVDASLPGHCVQYKNIAPPPGLSNGPLVAPPSLPAPRN
jgi:hypothetical protein